jgi:hypothetical protein
MDSTPNRPPNGPAFILELGREALADLGSHPAGRPCAELTLHALLGVLRSCRTADELFARHNDRQFRAADSAFVASAFPVGLLARLDDAERLVGLIFPIREAALLLRWRELTGGH